MHNLLAHLQWLQWHRMIPISLGGGGQELGAKTPHWRKDGMATEAGHQPIEGHYQLLI